jgi:hypothetical protein
MGRTHRDEADVGARDHSHVARMTDEYPGYDRRASDRDLKHARRHRVWTGLVRAVTPRDLVVAAIALAAAVFGSLGFSIQTPRRIAQRDSVRIDTLAAQIALEATAREHLSRRVDSLDTHRLFDEYLLCVIARKVDPDGTPSGCGPVIQTWRRP